MDEKTLRSIMEILDNIDKEVTTMLELTNGFHLSLSKDSRTADIVWDIDLARRLSKISDASFDAYEACYSKLQEYN